jgi:hypothetical protein
MTVRARALLEDLPLQLFFLSRKAKARQNLV